LRLDVCRSCKGVWFDHVELEAIWKLALTAPRRNGARGTGVATASAAEDSAVLLVHALAWSPELVLYGAHAAGYAVSASAQVLANAPEAAAGIAAGVGEAAESVFETILEIVSGLFS
jgi:hypothetical protein